MAPRPPARRSACTAAGRAATCVDTVAPRVPMDRDFVIAWRPQVGVAPAIAALTETVGDTTYALLMILPPAAAHTGRVAAARADLRDRQLGIDGRAVDRPGQSCAEGRARPARQRRSLQRDRLRLDDAASLYAAPQDVHHARPTRKRCAYVDGLVADGGTKIGAAIDDGARAARDLGLSAASHLSDGRRRRRRNGVVRRDRASASATHACSRSASARRRTRISCARRRSSAAARTRTSATPATSARR